MSDVLDPTQRKLIGRILMHVRAQPSPDGPVAVLSPLLLTADEVSRIADLYPCHMATEAERKKLGDLYSMHEDSRMLREAFPRFLDLMERALSLLEADRARDDLTRSLREAAADEDTQERMRPDLLRPRPPHINLPEIVTPATPGEPAQRRSKRKHDEDKPTAGERVLALVERHPYPTLGALVLVLAIVYGVVPQLVELAQVAGSAAVDALPPIPSPFQEEP